MIGIVILNYKNYQDVFPCVESIEKTVGLPYKIYIVDNASPNESVEKLTERYGGNDKIEIIVSDKNGGFSAGNNIGLKRAVQDGCEAVLCTNSDVEFYENAVHVMKERLFSSEKCGVVGPKVYCADGSIQECNKGILDAKTFILRRKMFSWLDWCGAEKKYTYQGYDYKEPLVVKGMVSGCCFMIKSTVLQQVDYLDENVFLYHEEDILGARLRNAGYYVILDPKAEILHYGGKSTGGVSAFTRYCTFTSAQYYLYKYSQSTAFGLWLSSLVTRLIFFAKSIVAKEYAQYSKKLKQDIKKYRKMRAERIKTKGINS